MGKINKRPRAEADLDLIWLAIAENSISNADSFLDTVEHRLTLLAEHPEMAEACHEIRPRLRKSPVGNYVIYYLPDADGIEVVRVLHAARDVRTLF